MITLKKAILLLSPKERRLSLIVLLLVMGMALLETAGVASVMPFLALLGNPEMLETNSVLYFLYGHAQSFGIDTPDAFLIALGIGAFFFIVISAMYRTMTYYVMNRFIEMRRHSISRRLLETYLRQPYAFFLQRNSSEMSKNILSEVDHLIGEVFRPAFNMFAYSLVIFAITALLVIVNPLLAILAAGLLGGLYIIIYFILKQKLVQFGTVLVEANKKRFTAAGEALSGIKIIKLLGNENFYLNQFSSSSQKFASTHANLHTFNQIPNFLIEAIIFGAMLILTLFLMVTTGGVNGRALGEILPILGLYAFAAFRLKPAVNHVYQGFASLRYGAAAVGNLHHELYPDTDIPPIETSKSTSIKVNNHIKLDRLSFSYPNTSKPALVDLNIEIPIGSLIGLVGSTGAGKTTLVDVILGLLRPTEGVITLDGDPITNENLRAWQNNIGYVPQDIFLTDTSVKENIAFGVPEAEIDHEHVVNCARMAQVHDFIIDELKEQYDTVVGERGVRLSGGQRQRIGIARALYHNPEVLVFDEATSALDTVTEKAVMNAIDDLAQQKTIIIIAHRLSTVKSCDQIVLLDQGKIKDIGKFDDLKMNNEDFKTMDQFSS